MDFLRRLAFSIIMFNLIISLTVSFIIDQKLLDLLEWFVILFASFTLGNIINYYINKFLEKKLNFDDFDYLKKAVIITGREVIFWLILPFILFLFSVSHIAYAPDPSISRISILLVENPLYWIFFCGILMFSYRMNHIKISLIKLQNEHNCKILDK